MGIKIDDTSMRAQASGATAEKTEKGWRVSWLPERKMDRNHAVTAMVLAEELAEHRPADDDRWLFIDGWAEELGLTRHQALELLRPAQKGYEHSGPCLYCQHGIGCVTCVPETVNGPVCTNCAEEIQRREIAADPYFSGNYLAMFGDDE